MINKLSDILRCITTSSFPSNPTHSSHNTPSPPTDSFRHARPSSALHLSDHHAPLSPASNPSGHCSPQNLIATRSDRYTPPASNPSSHCSSQNLTTTRSDHYTLPASNPSNHCSPQNLTMTRSDHYTTPASNLSGHHSPPHLTTTRSGHYTLPAPLPPAHQTHHTPAPNHSVQDDPPHPALTHSGHYTPLNHLPPAHHTHHTPAPKHSVQDDPLHPASTHSGHLAPLPPAHHAHHTPWPAPRHSVQYDLLHSALTHSSLYTPSAPLPPAHHTHHTPVPENFIQYNPTHPALIHSGHCNPPSHDDPLPPGPKHSGHNVLPPPALSHSGHHSGTSDNLSSSLPSAFIESDHLISQHPVSIPSDFNVLPPPAPSYSGHHSGTPDGLSSSLPSALTDHLTISSGHHSGTFDNLGSSLPSAFTESDHLISQHPQSDFDIEKFLEDNIFLGEIKTKENFSSQFLLTSDLPYCSASFNFPSSFPDTCLSQAHFSGTPINNCLPSLLGSSNVHDPINVTSLPGLSGQPPPDIVPEPPFSTLPGLRPVDQVMAEVPGKSIGELKRLTVALAKQSIFGEEEMARSSLRARRDLLALDEQKVNYIKVLVRSRVPSKSEVDFEAIWKLCRESLSKACQLLRKK